MIGTPQQKADAEVRAQEILQEQRRIRETMWLTFTSPPGVEALKILEREAFCEDTTLRLDVTGRVDPIASAANEGMRTMVVKIKRLMRDAKEDRDAEPQTAPSPLTERTP